MYFHNFSVEVIQGPHKERTFLLGRSYEVLAIHFENREFSKSYVMLENDKHSLQRVP